MPEVLTEPASSSISTVRTKKEASSMSPGSSEWGMLDRTRALDYFNLRGLSTLSGCDASQLDVVCMKELIDNGLDASKGSKPKVTIELKTVDEILSLTVKDSGEGLSPLDIDRVTDFGKLTSSKYYNKVPNRGSLGNALKVVMGATYALSAATSVALPEHPIRIRSRSTEYNIELCIDELKEVVMPRIELGEALLEGTEVRLALPAYGANWGWKQGHIELLCGYALFNPEADLSLQMARQGEEQAIHWEYPSVIERGRRFKGRPSIHWLPV